MFSFTGHSGGALAATSVIHHIESHDLIARAEIIGGELITELDALQKEFFGCHCRGARQRVNDWCEAKG